MENIIDKIKWLFLIAFLSAGDWYFIKNLPKLDGLYILLGISIVAIFTAFILYLIWVAFFSGIK